MKLIDFYEQEVNSGVLIDDPLQREVLGYLQRLTDELHQQHTSWFPWRRKNAIKGIYLYGSVGVGKTFLIDFFYQHSVEKNKSRFHFHHFMQQIDLQLRKLQGHKNPLQQIAKRIAQSTRLICFDEFMVHDVAYAMILADLLQSLMDQGVVLLFSSNIKPDDLYLNGPHRDRFLPAISLIKKNCEVLHLDEQRDYRLGRESLLETYLTPLTEQNQQRMEQHFARLTVDVEENGIIEVQNREIPYLKRGVHAIWFDFNQLCTFPRSQLDYLELANRFDTVFVSGIPALTEQHTAQTIMFIYLIDVLYDRGIKLVLSAAAPIEELYVKGEMKSVFQRTLSRLQEMQSRDYLVRHPRRVVQDLK